MTQDMFNVRSFLRDRRVAITSGVLCVLAVGGMAYLLAHNVQAAVLMAVVVAVFWVVPLLWEYVRRRRFYQDLCALTQQLDHAYMVSSLLEEPNFLEGRKAYQALVDVGRVAADEVAQHRERAESYREYVEMWIHEIKTPISAAGLITARLTGRDAALLKRELDRIELYVEQALYYARSTSLVSDYAIHELSLAKCIRQVCKKNARFMIERGATPQIDLSDEVCVLADEKWLAFVLGQVVVNAAKYGASTIRFSVQENSAADDACGTTLEIADDGCGIAAGDVPRVFERGFTGENGRAEGSSTGMGLYLAAVMCEKMGLGLALASEEGTGTRVLISFPHDRRRLNLTES